MLQAECQIFRTEHMPHVCRSVCAEYACGRTENYEKGHNRYQTENLWQYEVARRVYSHYVKGIYLLGNPHRADFRCYVGTDLSRED